MHSTNPIPVSNFRSIVELLSFPHTIIQIINEATIAADSTKWMLEIVIYKITHWVKTVSSPIQLNLARRINRCKS